MVPFAVGRFPKLPRICLISVSGRRNALGMVGLGIGERGLSQGVGALRGFGWGAYSPARRPYGDQVWRPDNRVQKQPASMQVFLHPQSCACYGGCARETLGSAGYSVPVRQPAYSCHPFVWRRMRGGLIHQQSTENEPIHAPNGPRLHRPRSAYRHQRTPRRAPRRRRVPDSRRHATVGKPGLPRTAQQRCCGASRLRPTTGYTAAGWV